MLKKVFVISILERLIPTLHTILEEKKFTQKKMTSSK